MHDVGKVTIQNAMNDLGITEAQAKKLDALDGDSNDVINIDIYTMSKLVLAHNQNDKEYVDIYSKSLGASDLSVFLEVQKIMNETGDLKVKDGTSVKDYPPPQYFDKNSSADDTKFHYDKLS